jgi:hypothetical protein
MTEWKRILDPAEIFLPYTLLTIVLTETAFYNVFIYQRLIDQFAGQSYLHYLSLLISPMLFFLVVHVFTPESGDNTKDYFIKRMPMFYSLLALLIASNFILELEDSKIINISRIVFIIVMVLCGLTRKIWLTHVLVFMWLLSFLVRGATVSG